MTLNAVFKVRAFLIFFQKAIIADFCLFLWCQFEQMLLILSSVKIIIVKNEGPLLLLNSIK